MSEIKLRRYIPSGPAPGHNGDRPVNPSNVNESADHIPGVYEIHPVAGHDGNRPVFPSTLTESAHAPAGTVSPTSTAHPGQRRSRT